MGLQKYFFLKKASICFIPAGHALKFALYSNILTMKFALSLTVGGDFLHSALKCAKGAQSAQCTKKCKRSTAINRKCKSDKEGILLTHSEY